MNKGSRKIISVIIPTRERAETLKTAIDTVLCQDGDSFELIVSDNNSQDNTCEIVNSVRDPRLKYVNTGHRLSMCDSYEFALSHAEGRYTIIIGDDDAIMPGALNRLIAEIETNRSPIYMWPKGIYVWPFPGRNASIERLAPVIPPHVVDLKKLARRCVRQGLWGYTRLPNAYHSAIERRLFDDIRATTGRVFHSTQPDLFTGFALPAIVDTAVNVGYPVTFHGRSVKSNGGVAVVKEAVSNFHLFVKEYGDYPLHPTLFPEIATHANLLPDALLIAMDKFPALYGDMRFNYEGMWTLFCLNHTFGFDVSATQVIQRAKDIRRHHPFSIPRFLAFMTAYKAFLSVRALVGGKTALGPFQHQVPDNILDFVRQLDAWQSGKGTGS